MVDVTTLDPRLLQLQEMSLFAMKAMPQLRTGSSFVAFIVDMDALLINVFFFLFYSN